MRKTNLIFSFTLLAALFLGACASASPTATAMMEKPAADMMAEPTADMMAEPTKDSMAKPTDDMMAEPTKEMMDNNAASSNMGMVETPMAGTTSSGEMMKAPEWFDAMLTDVNSGETFTINQLQGKVILVETMAVWCSNCLAQQKQIKALHEQLGMNEDFVSIALDIDANETPDILKAHADKYGFDWRYAVSSVDLSRQISNLYGAQFLNPPSVPVLIIDRHGEVHILPFGVKSAESLYEQVSMYLDVDM